MKVLIFLVASIVVIQAFKPDYNIDVGKEGNVYSQSMGRGILDSVQQVIYDLLQNAMELLNSLRTALTNVLGSALSLLTGLIKDAENLLSTIANDILQQIQQVEEIHLPCVANQEDNVQKILGAARKDIHICIDKAFETIENVHNDTTSFETDIANEISKIKQLLSQCFSINPIEIIQCVVGQVNEISQSLSEIAFTAKKSIQHAATEVDGIVQDTRSCIDNVVKDARNQLDAVGKDIINCIESQKPN